MLHCYILLVLHSLHPLTSAVPVTITNSPHRWLCRWRWSANIWRTTNAGDRFRRTQRTLLGRPTCWILCRSTFRKTRPPLRPCSRSPASKPVTFSLRSTGFWTKATRVIRESACRCTKKTLIRDIRRGGGKKKVFVEHISLSTSLFKILMLIYLLNYWSNHNDLNIKNKKKLLI